MFIEGLLYARCQSWVLYMCHLISPSHEETVMKRGYIDCPGHTANQLKNEIAAVMKQRNMLFEDGSH